MMQRLVRTAALLACFATPVAALAQPSAAQQPASAETAQQQASAETAQTCTATTQEAPKKKKHGLGLGGLLSAAKNSGLGSLVGGGSLFNGKDTGGQVLGAITGTVVNGGGTGSPMGTGRAAQVASALAGTAVAAAHASAAERPQPCGAG